jgi:hypothetical protein
VDIAGIVARDIRYQHRACVAECRVLFSNKNTVVMVGSRSVAPAFLPRQFQIGMTQRDSTASSSSKHTQPLPVLNIHYVVIPRLTDVTILDAPQGTQHPARSAFACTAQRRHILALLSYPLNLSNINGPQTLQQQKPCRNRAEVHDWSGRHPPVGTFRSRIPPLQIEMTKVTKSENHSLRNQLYRLVVVVKDTRVLGFVTLSPRNHPLAASPAQLPARPG